MRGFTLLELLAALLIAATAFAIALPSLTGGSGTELLSAARTAAAGLRQTRSLAIAANRAAVIEFDVKRREMVLDGRTRKLPEELRVGLFTARRERIDNDRGTIRFFPDGSSTGGRVMLGNDSRTFLVEVDWLTGRVSILDGGPDDWDRPTEFAPVRLQ